MRVLVLGGSVFVGRAVVGAALAAGHDVTTFTRTSVPAGAVEALHGDRRDPGQLGVLAGRDWDAVVDTWSGVPRVVRDAAAVLADRTRHYGYVSSRSVYRWPIPPGAAEDAPVVDGSPDDDAGEYAEIKAGAERAVVAAFGPQRSLLARAGLILGPHENVGRLPWWLRRVERGGDVLAPGPPGLPLQYVDARDLADWMLRCAERGVAGTYNAVSPPGHTTMGELLDACVAVTGSDARLVWIDPIFLTDRGVEGWTDLPIWAPPHTEVAALHSADTTRAQAAGLRCRPVAETVADTWRWLTTEGAPPARPTRAPVGLDPDRERTLLAAWLGR